MTIEAIEALDRLNSWVRSKSFRSGARRMIYHMKSDVLWCSNLPMEHRGIIVAVKCRDCGGTGRYRDWGGNLLDHCRACNSTGTAKLRFIETKIAERIVWHTPAEKYPRGWEGGFEIEMSYAPNQIGNDLEISEAARLLNLAEPCFPRPHDCCTEYGEFNDFNYSLYVGRTDPEICSLCGTMNDRQYGYSVTRNHIEWSDFACVKCEKDFEKKNGGIVSIFKAFALPQHLVSHPEIQRWMDRHATIQQVRV